MHLLLYHSVLQCNVRISCSVYFFSAYFMDNVSIYLADFCPAGCSGIKVKKDVGVYVGTTEVFSAARSFRNKAAVNWFVTRSEAATNCVDTGKPRDIPTSCRQIWHNSRLCALPGKTELPNAVCLG